MRNGSRPVSRIRLPDSKKDRDGYIGKSVCLPRLERRFRIVSYTKLHPVWLKAALLGSLWGSIEIIIGSFLHNLRIPFTGTILSAVGVSLLVGGHVLWRENGLVWRSGVVCALMKSVSPSAVILGPMIGIAAEAFSLELFVRLSRGTRIGYIFGGVVTVCIPFLQNIVSLIITYGFNIALLFEEIYRVIAGYIGIQNLTAYDIVGLFILLNAIFGFVGALLGIAVGKNAIRRTPGIPVEAHKRHIGQAFEETGRYSTVILFLTLAIVPAMLYSIGGLPLGLSAFLVFIYISLTLKLYPFIRERLLKPKLWIELVAVAVTAGLLLGKAGGGGPGSGMDGITTGIQMSLRALFMVAAFTVIGVELRNPDIIDWIMKKGLGQVGSAVGVAFDALPLMVASLGNQRDLITNPIKTLSRMLLAADEKVRDAGDRQQEANQLFFLTGKKGIGKTTLLSKLVEECKIRNIHIGGILSPSVFRGRQRIGYDVVNIETSVRVPLCRIGVNDTDTRIGDLNFLHEGLRAGNQALGNSDSASYRFMIIDEIGPLELEGEGWAGSLDLVAGRRVFPLIIVVRENLIGNVKRRWKISPDVIWKVDTAGREKLMMEMLREFNIT